MVYFISLMIEKLRNKIQRINNVFYICYNIFAKISLVLICYWYKRKSNVVFSVVSSSVSVIFSFSIYVLLVEF